MQFHVITTERCNLKCTYCGGTRHIPGLPLDIEYETDDLIDLVSRAPDPVIGFYGGEPLLAPDRVMEIMDRVPAKAFTLQTNGTRIRDLPDEYLLRLHSILISVDGPREITDRCRGKGTYDRLMEGVRHIRSIGYQGDLIARMAFSDAGDIYRDVTHLLSIFDHVHWQLNVMWSDLEARGDIGAWLDSYDSGISRLADDLSSSLEEGEVLGIVPFIPVMNTLISGKPTRLRCGAGLDSFAIMTSGSIEACPVAPELLYSNIGDIRNSVPKYVFFSRPVGPPCTGCDILDICGGRCLYANRTMSWGREWFERVCASTRHMIEELRHILPSARKLMEDGTLKRDAFEYPEINNGCEIIP